MQVRLNHRDAGRTRAVAEIARSGIETTVCAVVAWNRLIQIKWSVWIFGFIGLLGCLTFLSEMMIKEAWEKLVPDDGFH